MANKPVGLNGRVQDVVQCICKDENIAFPRETLAKCCCGIFFKILAAVKCESLLSDYIFFELLWTPCFFIQTTHVYMTASYMVDRQTDIDKLNI